MRSYITKPRIWRERRQPETFRRSEILILEANGWLRQQNGREQL